MLSRQAITRDAYESLRDRIIHGRYTPGQRLPTAKLAADLGISRTPVREALLMLEAEGLVTGVHHQGFRVRELTREKIEKLYDLRAMLEAFAAGKAAERAGEIPAEEVDFLRNTIEQHDHLIGVRRIHAPDNITAMMQANRSIHDTIVAASRYPRLPELITQTIDPGVIYRAFDLFTREELQRTNEFHKMIVDRILEGDADRAAHLMSEHVFQSRDIVLARIDGADGDVAAVFRSV